MTTTLPQDTYEALRESLNELVDLAEQLAEPSFAYARWWELSLAYSASPAFATSDWWIPLQRAARRVNRDLRRLL